MRAPTALVTGATDGIGRETARQLAEAGARVLAHGRDPARVAAVVAALPEVAGARHAGLTADFASLDAVRLMAEEAASLLGGGPEGRGSGDAPEAGTFVLVNNAGVYSPQRRVTPDGFELTFQVNHLAPFLLTRLLEPVLLARAPAARVVTVSSGAHRSGRLDFRDLMQARAYDAYGAYAASKLANVLFAYALARRLEDSGVTSNCMNPGRTATKMLAAAFPGQPGRPVAEAAGVVAYLALSPAVARTTGAYFEGTAPVRSSAESYDVGLQERLWEASERLVGLAG